MIRMVAITDDKKRDAHVAMAWPSRAKRVKYVSPTGANVRFEKLIRATLETSHDMLLAKYGSAESLAKALVDEDPEIPMEVVGRRLGDASRVYMRKDGTLLSVARVLQVVKAPDGTEKSRQEFIDVEATVSEDSAALPWTGRLFPIEETIRKVVFTRKAQLRHVSGLTYEFLYNIAKTLHDAKKLLMVGAGAKGQTPLIFATNGAPYRGFMEGRVDGDGYLLILHLSNLELKSVAEKRP